MRNVDPEKLKNFESFTRIWLKEGRINSGGGSHGDPVSRLEAEELLKNRGQYDVVLTMEELEAVLPQATLPFSGEPELRLYVPLTLLSEYLGRPDVESNIARDPSHWMFDVEFVEYGLEVVNGKLVKKRQATGGR